MRKRTVNMILSTVLAAAIGISTVSAAPAGGTEVITLEEKTQPENPADACDRTESVSDNDVTESLSANGVEGLTPDDAVTPTIIEAGQLVAVDCLTAGKKCYYQFTKTPEVKANGITFSLASGGTSSYPMVKISEVSDNQETQKKEYEGPYSKGTYFPFEDGKTYRIEAGMYNPTATGAYTFKIINGSVVTGLDFDLPKTTIAVGEVVIPTCSITVDDATLPYLYNAADYWFSPGLNCRKHLVSSRYISSGYKYIRPIEMGNGSVTFWAEEFPTFRKTIDIEVVPPEITGEMKAGETKNVQIDGSGFVIYSFVPAADDAYVFESVGIDDNSYNTYGYIYDSNFKILFSNDDGGEGKNFAITQELKKGETYYLAARLYSESTINVLSFNINLRSTATKVPVVIPVKPVDDSVYIDTMKMDYRKLTLAKGRSFKLTLLTSPIVFDSTITWESSRPKVASVNQKGVVRAKLEGKSAIITATTSEGLVASCVVKVPKVEVKSTGVGVKKDEVTLTVGKTCKIKAKMQPANTTDNITYKSKNEKIAVVSSKGTVTAVKKGKTKITVKTTSGKKAVVNVIVK